MAKSQNKKRYFVYVLCDPRDTRVRYVGCSVHPTKRLAQHMSSASGCGGVRTEREEWLWGLRQAGLKPTLYVVAESSSIHRAARLELHWIWDLGEKGAALLNGDGCRRYPGTAKRANEMFTARLARQTARRACRQVAT